MTKQQKNEQNFGICNSKEETKDSLNLKFGKTGLNNLGNTCFLNSILQCIAHTAPLVEQVREKDNKVNASSKMSGRAYSALRDFIRDYWNNSPSSLRPSGVKDAIGSISAKFRGFQQHDSHEAFTLLMEQVHEDLNRIGKKRQEEMKDVQGESSAACAERWSKMSKGRDDSIITDIFEGQFLKYFKCKDCGWCSRNCDMFLSLSVSLRSNHSKLEDSLVDQFKSRDSDGYKCSKCKGKCEQYQGLYSLPKVLVVHLERFEAKGMRSSKLNTSISIPTSLDLKNFCKESEHPSVNKNQSLYGISHHMGSLGGGHQVADVCHSGTWYRCDDSHVQESKPTLSGSSPYLLFYIQN